MVQLQNFEEAVSKCVVRPQDVAMYAMQRNTEQTNRHEILTIVQAY